MVIGAVDIGGTKIAVGLVDESGRLLAQVSTPTAQLNGFAAGMESIAAMLRACLAEQPAPLAGIGIGCTGPVEPVSGVLGPNYFLPGWEGENPVASLSEAFRVPAAVENDADAAALAEAAWGAGRGVSQVVYLTVSTGIGGGLVLDGRLYRGVAGAHPEIGHHVIDPDGPPCFCGARGCFESLCSGPALAGWYLRQPGAVDPANTHVDARLVCQMAAAGDPVAQAAVERAGFYLGSGLANLVNLYTPGVIVLGGGVMESWSLFEDRARATIRQNCGLVPWEKTELRQASLGAQTGLSGAARVWLHRFYPESG